VNILRVLLCGVVASGMIGCGKSDPSEPTAATNAAAPGENPLNAPADYLGAAAKAKNVAVKVVDTAALNQAVQLFNAAEGRNPTDLNELVTTKYLPRIPDAPPGQKISYNPNTGEVKVVPQ
jgi:hypothetical protein